ncbi:MAG TPA: MFS transporter, partial [Rugosimonospora sp.]|nr:MFS transporter [Rugosimonospora sp.]
QEVRGYSALTAGLCTLPMAAMSLIFAPISGRLVGTYGARPSLLAAGVLMAAGAAVFTRLAADTPLAVLMVGYVVFGIGFALVNAPITNTAVSGMPLAQAGVAAAVASTSRQVGSALGIAVTGSVAASRLVGPLSTGFAVASRAAWWILVGCGLVVLVLGFASTTARAKASAARVAERFPEHEPATRPVPAGAR